ncbi:polyprenyl synthetase family protein [Kocuria sp. p3-SID1433]|uniref:polyprenyl synthetase family protein n=1 Tax=unclassified Kocuria TaxID=2649579 RepID=UPI0021A8B557|nr:MULTISPECIES: polyprenyl synthetase family protein [unclassified Kocuria]MCT1601778.1 polyprenyl synthetase family protein [Kocuria sp. p3-SID1428]MCT2179764.1 polyprenyl synthetase family protein [Kocuria sp. p3-SID1433]
MTTSSFAPDSDSPSPDLARAAAAESEAFRRDVDAVLQGWFHDQRTVAEGISEAAGPVVEAIAGLSTGGKRTRAQLLYWSWRAAGGAADSRIPRLAGAGIELFQTAALIHDDIIDRSATRRGMASIHVQFADRHRDAGWSQDSAHFGTSAAVLAGDLALTWSEQLFGEAVELAGHPEGAAADFTRMRTEVMLGQYLDIHAEVAAGTLPPHKAIERAFEVLRYKSAKYSAEHPAALGALLAGAPSSFVEACREFALPLGEAFQIRDDVLGVFGDPRTTGKPAGDDLREGKRTVLIGQHLRDAQPQDARLVAEALGDQSLDDARIEQLRGALRRSGALQRTEEMVDELSQRTDQALAQLPVEDLPRAGLHLMAEALIRRAR